MLALLQAAPAPWSGNCRMELVSPDTVGRLIAATRYAETVSLLTFEGTVDMLADLSGVRVLRTRTDHKHYWTPATGDRAILCRIKPAAKGLAQADLRPHHFDFWLYTVESAA